nr:triple gene block protein 1 [Garlic yellow mosaic-associated virus]
MNKLLELLTEFEFIRTNIPISKPLVVHAVPGAGKTTLLRKFLSTCSSAEVITSGVGDKPNLLGKRIVHGSKFSTEGSFRIFDEYITSESIPDCEALFSDPIQNNKEGLPAHYIKKKSLRVPKAICDWLQTLGFEIESEVEGELSFEEFFGPDPVGKTVAFETDVLELLRKHNCDFSLPCEIRGLEFDTVTLFTEKDCSELSGFELYIAATRAKKRLIVRTANAN